MTNTLKNENPPPVPEGFKDMFTSFLNLKGKKAVDGKNIIRFLSTSLSNRCFEIYKDICRRNNKLPASKFDCLRGLTEVHAFNFLQKLKKNDLEREDWQQFPKVCEEKQNRKKKQRKVVTATIQFKEDSTTRLFIGIKAMVGNIVCLKFLDSDENERILTCQELKMLVFGKQSTSASNEFPVYHSLLHMSSTPKNIAGSSENILIQEDEDKEKNIVASPIHGNCFTANQKGSAKGKQKLYVKKCLHEPSIYSEPAGTLSKYKRNVYSFPSLSPDKNEKDNNSYLPCSDLSEQDFTQNLPVPPEIDISAQSDPCTISAKVAVESGKKRSLPPTCSNTIRQNNSEVGLNASVGEFLYKIVDEVAAKNAELRRSKIKEDEVETQPENLINDIQLVLDPEVQKAAKAHFTEDAWLLVLNTLGVLQDKFAVDLQRQYNFASCSQEGKGKTLCGLKGRGKKRKAVDQKKKSLKIRVTDISSVKDLPGYIRRRENANKL